MCVLTGKRSSDKNRGKATNTTNKWSTGDMPVFAANVMSAGVAAAVDNDAHDNENLENCEPKGCYQEVKY